VIENQCHSGTGQTDSATSIDTGPTIQDFLETVSVDVSSPIFIVTSGGRVTDTDVDDVLRVDGSGPEFAPLRRLLDRVDPEACVAAACVAPGAALAGKGRT
jgi:hypothetical protein